MSDHFDGGRYFNPSGANGQPFFRVPRMLLTWRARWPRVAVTATKPPSIRSPGDIAVTFIGHATFLIQTAAGNILTDPLFSNRASPFAFAGPRRSAEPGVRFEDLPLVGLVLLSHNHYDHCDLPALARLARRFAPLLVTPPGNARLARAAGVTKVRELDWWEQLEGSVRVTVTPAQHFSARHPFDRNRALWGGFVIEAAGKRIYFAGDSGYGAHFAEIGRRLGPFDLALLPIGAYEPRWFMKDIHMDPDEAVQAHRDVRARRSVPMHYGTLQLTPEPIDEPLQRLAASRQWRGVPEGEFRPLAIGATLAL